MASWNSLETMKASRLGMLRVLVPKKYLITLKVTSEVKHPNSGYLLTKAYFSYVTTIQYFSDVLDAKYEVGEENIFSKE